MALTQIKSGAIADDAIDSSTYIDGSIDNAHLADDVSGDCAELKAVADALWTTEVVAAYKASQTPPTE